MPTARNARGVDIIAYDQDAARFVGVQVKALSKRAPVPLGSSVGRLMGDYWIIVNGVTSSSPSSFVMVPSEVRTAAFRGEKDGKVSYWLQPPAYDRPEFHEQWGRIAVAPQ
jgi:hypothetical protein